MTLNLVNKREICQFSCASRSMMEQFAFIVVSSLMHTCMGSHRSRGYLEPRWGECCAALFFSLRGCFQDITTFLIFLLPSLYSPFCPHCYHSVTGARMSLCVCGGSWLGCRACQQWECFTDQGLADHSRGPGTPGHPPSTQLDSVVKGICSINNKFTH